MDTCVLTLRLPATWHELAIAELAALGCEAFEEADTVLKAYVPDEQWTPEARQSLAHWANRHDLDLHLEEERIAPQNWNAQWEATIQSLVVGSFLIKPTWQPIPPAHEDLVLLEMNPKMSFGTGYHESTRLVLRALSTRTLRDLRMLDAGTGTGILGIAALKCGAEHVLAFDIDPWVEANVEENIQRNGVADRFTYRTGTLDVIPETGFDLITANINRSVLIDLLPTFKEKLLPDGVLILAGLLRDDAEVMHPVFEEVGFAVTDEQAENEWWSVTVRHAA